MKTYTFTPETKSDLVYLQQFGAFRQTIPNLKVVHLKWTGVAVSPAAHAIGDHMPIKYGKYETNLKNRNNSHSLNHLQTKKRT